MNNRFIIIFASVFAFCLVGLSQDRSVVDKHIPLPLDYAHSHEAHLLAKKAVASRSLCDSTVSLVFSNYTGKRAKGSPDDPDYAIYGSVSKTLDMHGMDMRDYDRIYFKVFPDCGDVKMVNLNVDILGNSHLVNLRNGEWNECTLDIGSMERSHVDRISFRYSLNGFNMMPDKLCKIYFKDLRLERTIDREPDYGWKPYDKRIIVSTTGYSSKMPKTAIMASSDLNSFKLVDCKTGKTSYSGKVRKESTTIGDYGVLDFSKFNKSGIYRLETENLKSPEFEIGDSIWTNSIWKAINFLFCQRCGYEVLGIHPACHHDVMAKHDGKIISYDGGWHDAGDLSQQTLQTGDVSFALLEAYSKMKGSNPRLAERLREEALWGLRFILKCRFGDGYRASSMGLLLWTDGKIGTWDDIYSVRVQNFAFDNFLYSGYEAYAAMVLKDDKTYSDNLRKVAEEDFHFAEKKFIRDGYDTFMQPYEHTYNTSLSQYHATISWASSMLFKLTGKNEYAKKAAEAIKYTLACQETRPVKGICGYFYRDTARRSIVHYIHQSREQIYMQALAILCETQPQNPEYSKWMTAIRLYGGYIKSLMKYTKPYGMIPSGVYLADEYLDIESFEKLHIFPPRNAAERYTRQLENGVKLDDSHYVKRFPVWFGIFNGNNAVLLSMGKAAAICGNVLNDQDLRNIASEQLYWMVGKNPFGQSMIYGEGDNYPQMDSFSTGEMTGEMPVGIKTIGDEDVPYWPQVNNACYKEVWVTVAGKWLSLVSEY